MTLTILTLPTTYFEALDLNPEHVIATARSRGGFTSEIRTADPMWTGTMTTAFLDEDELRLWEQFIADATERMLPFDFVHPLRTTPIAYTIATMPWDGTGNVTNLSDLRSPHVSGFPIGAVLTKGDRISFHEGDHVCYRMIGATVTVSSNSNQTLSVSPRLPTGLFTTSATVKMLNPVMRLRVAPNSWSAELEAGQPVRGKFDVYEAPR